ncbi:MAG: hypothetical protein HGA49_08920 [Eubacteriaceae bacterium]|nr:hypothetical protein [Eubacteriaceae bacterium]
MEPEIYNQSSSLTVRAAYLYYIEDLPQSEIASILKVSVPTVSRLIMHAKEEKIIEFVIKNPYLDSLELEQKLKKTFNLKDVVIASDLANQRIPNVKKSSKRISEAEIDEEKRLVAIEGAKYVQRIISKDDKLGITFGKTMYYMIHYLNPCKKIKAKFITLHGSIAAVDYKLDVISLVHRMSMAFGGESKIITTEGLVSNKELADALKKEKNIEMVLKSYDKVTIAVSGVGSFCERRTSLLCKNDFLNKEEIATLVKEDVVADVALSFINSKGEEHHTEINDRTIGIKFDQFMKIPTRIGMVSGVNKTQSLLACLKGGLFNVLIADYNLGKAVLELHEAENQVG